MEPQLYHQVYTDDSVTVWHGDCLDILPLLPDNSVDSVVTDPPYNLGFMGQCFHPETDILTVDGWKPVADMLVGDRVYSLNPLGRLEVTTITAAHQYPFQGELLKIGGRSVLQAVTPNHRVVIGERGDWDLVYAESLPSTFMMQNQAEPMASSNLDAKTYFAGRMWNDHTLGYLIGLWLGDGYLCVRQNQPWKQDFLGFAVYKERKVEAIRQALADGEIRFTETHSPGGKVQFYVYDAALREALRAFAGAQHKSIPSELFTLSLVGLEALYQGLIETDGCLQGNGQEVFYTVADHLADDFQHLCLLIGRSATRKFTKHGPRRIGGNRVGESQCWVLSVLPAQKRGCWLVRDGRPGRQPPAVRLVPFNGNVYCVTVDRHHNVMTRYEGKMVWSGNSWDRPGSAARGYKTDANLAETPYSRARAEYGGTSYGGKNLESMHQFQSWCEQWAVECLRVLKPGGHALIFGGTRTFHRLTSAVEDAGFEIRDCISYLYGAGFPKNLDVSKQIDKMAGAQREVVGQHPQPAANKPGGASLMMSKVGMPETAEITAPATEAAKKWKGWGTALRPSWEPIVVARKPLKGKNVASNVLEYSTGALNIDACRIEARDSQLAEKYASVQNAGPRENTVYGTDNRDRAGAAPNDGGRWPPNVLLDESQAEALDEQSGDRPGMSTARLKRSNVPMGIYNSDRENKPGIHKEPGVREGYDDTGGASRFFPVFKPEEHPGRWPPNVVLDESQAAAPDEQSGERPGMATQNSYTQGSKKTCYQAGLERPGMVSADGVRYGYDDSGGASRFFQVVRNPDEPSSQRTYAEEGGTNFAMKPGARRPEVDGPSELFPTFKYTAKAGNDERPSAGGVMHPTVKPLSLVCWMAKLVTPPHGIVLDCFAGSGTTGEAAIHEHMRAILIEKEEEYLPLIMARLNKPMQVGFDFD